MAFCGSLEDILIGCITGNAGSIATKIKVFDMEQVTGLTADTANTITNLVISGDPVTLELLQNTGNFDQPMAKDAATGGLVFNQTINLYIPVLSQAKTNAIMKLGVGYRKLGVVVTDGNGINWYFPNMELSAANAATNGSGANGNGYTLAFNNPESRSLANVITPQAVANL